MAKGVLYQSGELDVLLYYARVSKYLKKFLRGREIATKTILKNFKFLKRGSNSQPLFIQDFQKVNKKMLKLRTKHLEEARKGLNEKQVLIWQYFVPRKMVNFFYACNNEISAEINRIFIDIDRQSLSAQEAQKVALELVNQIKNDSKFKRLAKFKIFIMWTGSSFHVYLLLAEKVSLDFYNKYLSYGKGKELSFTEKWAGKIKQAIKINVSAGHQRIKEAIILDSSNTPPGKLARAPFSLHIPGYNKIDGVSVPLSELDLLDKKLVSKLKKLTPDKVLKDIKRYAKLL